jgi:hypothetical protein
MRIYHIGQSIKSVFPVDTILIGRHVEDIFRLVRPDILLEWNRVCISKDEENKIILRIFSRSFHTVDTSFLSLKVVFHYVQVHLSLQKNLQVDHHHHQLLNYVLKGK